MFKYILGIPLIFHGLAHVSGFLASWTRAEVGYAAEGWVLPGRVTLQSGVGRGFGLLWLVAMAGLVASGAGLLTGQSWWRPLAGASAAVSLAAIVPWWNTVPPGARIGAAFDVGVILWVLFGGR